MRPSASARTHRHLSLDWHAPSGIARASGGTASPHAKRKHRSHQSAKNNCTHVLTQLPHNPRDDLPNPDPRQNVLHFLTKASGMRQRHSRNQSYGRYPIAPPSSAGRTFPAPKTSDLLGRVQVGLICHYITS